MRGYRTRKFLRIISRVMGTLLLIFIIFIVVSHLFGDEKLMEGLRSTRDIIIFICFPVLATAGLILAFKWPQPGGWIIVLSMLSSYLMNPALLQNVYMGLITLTGVFYLLSAKKPETI